MNQPLTKYEAEMFENIQSRLCDIDDWITVDDFIQRTDRRSYINLAGEWELDGRETMKEAIGRMVEKGIVEFKLNDKNEGMVKCSYHATPGRANSAAYDRIFAKYRLEKLDVEVQAINETMMKDF